MTNVYRSMLLALGLSLAASLCHAGDAPSTSAAVAGTDEEAKVDDGLKSFGYLTGLARGCVADKQQVALETEAMDLHAAISRLLGTDRAFLFSSAFGYGTTVKVETKDCKEVLDRYDARVAKFRAAKAGAK